MQAEASGTRSDALQRSAGLLAMAAAALVATSLLLLTRSETGTGHWLGLTPDTQAYLAMMRGEPADAPFRFRVLAPWIASLLPLAPLDALRVVTWASLLGSYALTIRALRHLGADTRTSALALLTLVTCTRHLLLVQNPFLTDALGLLALTALLVALLEDRMWAFGLVAVVAVLAREDALFAAAAVLLTKRWRVGLVIVAAAVATYAALRVGHAGHTQGGPWLRLLGSISYWVKLYFGFGFLWLALACAAWLALRNAQQPLLAFIVTTLAGTLLSSLYARDTTRMVLPMVPALPLAVALVLQRVSHRCSWLAAWVVLLGANVVLAMPNTLLATAATSQGELEGWYQRWAVPIALHQAVGMAMVLAACAPSLGGGFFRSRHRPLE